MSIFGEKKHHMIFGSQLKTPNIGIFIVQTYMFHVHVHKNAIKIGELILDIKNWLKFL